MRSGHKMTIWEAENFLNQTSDVSRSLTDPWELDPAKEYDYEGNPTGNTHPLPFDSKILLDTIMLKGGELGILFNNIATYYRMNASWWYKWKPTFQRWWEVEEIEYNPMWDRDGRRRFHEDTTDTGYNKNKHSDTEVMDDDTTRQTVSKEIMDDDTTKIVATTEVMDDDTTKITSSTEVIDDDTTNTSSSTTHDVASGTNNSTTTNSVSAFNQGPPNTYSPHDSSTTNGSTGSTDDINVTINGSSTDDRTTTKNGSETGTDDRTTTINTSETGTDDRTTDTTVNETGTDDRTTTKNGTSDTDMGNDRDLDHDYREWGQWGISTISQNMYALQYKVRRQNNPYELMSDIFIKEMTDGVWV